MFLKVCSFLGAMIYVTPAGRAVEGSFATYHPKRKGMPMHGKAKKRVKGIRQRKRYKEWGRPLVFILTYEDKYRKHEA